MNSLKTKLLNGIIIMLSVIISICFWCKHGKKAYIFYGDALGYYSYLPSAFIYHNFKAIEYLPGDKGIDDGIIHYAELQKTENVKSPKGYYVNQYTYGVALTQLPFFLIAHTYEKVRGLPANGYSINYQYMMKLATLCYALLGLFFLYKSLRTLFSTSLSVFVCALILMGTNLFWFTFLQAGMSHVPLLFLYALLIFITIKVHEKPSIRNFILVGLVGGLITVIRPSDMICMLIPLLYAVSRKASLIDKFCFLKTNFNGVLLCLLVFVIPILPQMVFWKIYAGSFLYDSYHNQSFNWMKPKITEGLFSFSNGWFAYTPVMFIAVIGILFYKKIRPFLLPILVLLPLYIYIIYSWWCYNYINGFGSRPMIHLYPLLAFPLASIIYFLLKRNKLVQTISLLIILFLTSVNVVFSYQKVRGDLNSENSNFEFAVTTFFKTQLHYRDIVAADNGDIQPDNDRMKSIATLGFLNFNDTSYKAKQEEFPNIVIHSVYHKNIFKDADYFKCSGMFKVNESIDLGSSTLLVLEVKRKDSTWLWKGIKINNKIGKAEANSKKEMMHLGNCITNEWGLVYFYILIPDFIQEGDQVKLGIWNLGKQEFEMKVMKLEVCYTNFN